VTRHRLDVIPGKASAGETASILIIASAFLIPAVSGSPMIYSIANQILIAITAAFSVYIMMRMNLLTFAVPTFMAVGGYTAAIAGRRYGVTDLFVLTGSAFLMPALFALPLGALVLRLRGVYFVLVTFVLTQITQLILFETPSLTGGSNGIVGMPAVTLLGMTLADNQAVLAVTTGLALLGGIVTATLTRFFRQHFAAIEENEVLAESLGLVVWHYKALGFVVAAGISGLAGFALVNMLLTAHPTSFSALSSVNYIAYTIVGGKSSMLGPIVGSSLLVWAADAFAIRGEYSEGLFGLLLMIAVLLARDGIVGTAARWLRRLVPARLSTLPARRSASFASGEHR
jgi:branched-chain amino acid transport system permease protein